MAWLYYLVQPFVASFFKTIFLAWKVEGRENMPDEGAIYACNHNSNAEGILLNAIRYRPIRFLGKAELFDKKWKSIIMKGLGTIPVKRGESDRIAFKSAIESLQNGKSIGIFPEGTRGSGKKLLSPHTGVIRLAVLSGVPVVPVGISGGSRAWPKGKPPRLFKKVKVRIGEPWIVPVPSEGREYSYEELKQLAEYLMFELIEPLLDKDMELDL